MKVNDRFILDIKRVGINGEGIGFYNKLAVFVKNAIPGEGIEVEVTKVLPKMAIAKIVNFKKTSPYRENPPCPYYEKCGACQTMHIDYTEMLKYKKELLIESIRRYTKLNPKQFEIRDTLGMDMPYHYRNKSTALVRKYNNKLTVAMIEEDSNRTIPVDNCLILDDKINEINKKILDIANKLNIKAFPDANYSLRYLITRVSKATRESLVCLIVYKLDPEIKNLLIEINKANICDSLYVNINTDSKTHLIFGEQTIYFAGKKSIVEKIGNFEYEIYPTTFFQLNSLQTANLYERVKKAAKLGINDVVLDAYCGVGTIGLYLSKTAKMVYGIEYNKDSVKYAYENADKNKVKNVSFYQGSVTKLLPELIKKGYNFDVCIVDPPRTGLGEEVANYLINNPIKKLVYVSCNHSTLAKDLNILTKKYKVRYIEPIDMFPMTSGIETITLLCLKDAKK